MDKMRRIGLIILAWLCVLLVSAQSDTIRVLAIGNSFSQLLTLRDGGRSSLPSALLQAALVEQALRTKIHTETCWR